MEKHTTPESVGLKGGAKNLWQDGRQQLPMADQAAYDPSIKELETLGHLIGYVHATAAKRIGAGAGSGQRGVTRYDVEEVKAWFDPFAVTASVPGLKAQLKTIRAAVQKARPIAEHELEVLGVDPKTLGPIKGRKYESEIVAPPAAGETPPDLSQEQEDLLGAAKGR